MMKKEQLAHKLQEAGVNETTYWLDGGLPSERYTLEERPEGWAIYYAQRGERAYEEVFASEEEACNAFFERIMSDPTTH
ncbi:hypothetical protein O1R50_03460 [Glycomyces luteolus]|uniref:Uncharacterized protein n=1 Tax=Glycomyces luteolus TaxID=2670330 RepID=A0A9X3SRN6_9ACTN|nr:hypothetical protein [Glycomyces luteolus]MDA1358663.1 hypothetical protein [Glycomyces luteolus]